MKHRIFRIVIAVILVCALLVSWSPIRVSAMALPEATAATAHIIPFAQAVEPAALGLGGTIFCWVAMGLGVLFTAQQAVKAYNAYQDFSGDLETTIYYYPDGSWSYGVDMGFVERVRAFAFERGYLVESGNLCTIVAEGETFRKYTPRLPCVAYSYSYASPQSDGKTYKFNKVGYLVSLIPDDPYIIDGQKSTASITVNGKKHYAHLFYNSSNTIYESQIVEYVQNSPDFYHLGVGTWYLSAVWARFGWTGVEGSGDVAIDYVAPLAVPMIEAYPEWHTNARPATNPDTDEEITVLPIPLNPSVAPETQIGTLTQPDIWQGSIADPMPQPDSDTNIPSEDIGKFAVDLTSFFPFCLPFDIYAFFELLAADPETPHLEFDIELPFMQEPWHVVIDLSAWDSTALLARRLELLAFIIGLCVFTREKFLRS